MILTHDPVASKRPPSQKQACQKPPKEEGGGRGADGEEEAPRRSAPAAARAEAAATGRADEPERRRPSRPDRSPIRRRAAANGSPDQARGGCTTRGRGSVGTSGRVRSRLVAVVAGHQPPGERQRGVQGLGGGSLVAGGQRVLRHREPLDEVVEVLCLHDVKDRASIGRGGYGPCGPNVRIARCGFDPARPRP